MIFKWQERPWKNWKRLRQRLPHAILLQSGEGLGEFEFAQACAQSLLCEDPRPGERPCGACLAGGTHRAGLRVILVYPAEAMNANTQNALLKNLEEPPPATVFLLVTTQPERLLATVRSRCLRFALPFPPPEPVLRWLKEEGLRPH